MTKQKLIEEVFGKDANLYSDALFVDPGASDRDIEQAYLSQWQATRKKLTPGLDPRQAEFIEKKLEALLIAYRILSNPELRSRYNDMMTEMWSTAGSQASDDTTTPRKTPARNRRREQLQRKQQDLLELHEQELLVDRNQKNMYAAKSTKDIWKEKQKPPSHAPPNPYNAPNSSVNAESPADTSFGSSDGTIVPQFDKENLNNSSEINNFNNPVFFNNSQEPLGNTYEDTDDEDVFAGVDEEIDLGRSRERNVSFASGKQSKRANNTSSKNMDSKYNHQNNVKDDFESGDELDQSVSSRNENSSSLKKGRYTKNSEDNYERPTTPTLGVRFRGIPSADEDTIDDNTTFEDDTTLGDDDDWSLREQEDMDATCLSSLICVPQEKKFEMNRMLQEFSAEIKDSFDDTLSAVDQVFNAFTIQPEEYSELVTKIETEKQTLLFSSEFMKLAQQERQKRLQKNNKYGSGSRYKT